MQIDTFAATAADLMSVYTINCAAAAKGVATAAKRSQMPFVSFTVKTDGKLSTGQP